MSFSLQFYGERDIVVVESQQVEKQKVSPPGYIDWNVPSSVAFEIMAAEDPVLAMCDYVMSESRDELIDAYAEDDILCETPIGKNVVNYGEEFVGHFMDWVEEMRDNHFEIRCELI